MPSYSELMLQELQQQRSEQSRQHGELLGAIASLAQATPRLEQSLVQLQAQAQGAVQGQSEAQTHPPAKILHWLGWLGRWVASAFARRKNAC